MSAVSFDDKTVLLELNHTTIYVTKHEGEHRSFEILTIELHSMPSVSEFKEMSPIINQYLLGKSAGPKLPSIFCSSTFPPGDPLDA